MTDLRIDVAFLNELSAKVTLAASELEFAGWQFRAPGAQLLEALLVEAGGYPTKAADAFLTTDARLARTEF